MKGLHTSPARPKDEPHPRPEHCPGISGIAVPYLPKSLSGNYRNPCPGICETRTRLRGRRRQTRMAAAAARSWSHADRYPDQRRQIDHRPHARSLHRPSLRKVRTL